MSSAHQLMLMMRFVDKPDHMLVGVDGRFFFFFLPSVFSLIYSDEMFRMVLLNHDVLLAFYFTWIKREKKQKELGETLARAC